MTFNRTTVAWGVVWSAAILVSTGAMISAFNPQPDPPGHYYGLMSVKPGQRIALHLSNTRTSMVTEGAQQTGPARNLCSAELSLVDSCGTVVARQTGRLAPARSMSLDFATPNELPPGPCTGAHEPPDPDRQPSYRLRAQLVFATGGGHCVSSVEVGDPFVGDPTGLRGGGGFLHPGLIVGFNPQAEPPGDKQLAPR